MLGGLLFGESFQRGDGVFFVGLFGGRLGFFPVFDGLFGFLDFFLDRLLVCVL